MSKNISSAVLDIDCARETDRICEAIRSTVRGRYRRQGAVLGVSGGIDSSVTAALCTRALGKENVLGLMMPERESSDDTLELSQLLIESVGVKSVTEDITGILDSLGCYARRDEAVKTVIPEFQSGDRFKITLPGILDGYTFRVFSVVAHLKDGGEQKARLTPAAYLEVLAATNFKQRVRKMLEYYHADRLNFAVAGTPNRLEYDQGFFVKLGDGAADIKPIAHLYKTQVYALAEYLGVPEEIRRRPPTTDTYSLPQTQEEFYFSVPYDVMDICLYGRDHALPVAEVASLAGLSPDQVENIYRDIEAKRKATRYLHAAPMVLDV